MTSQATLWRVRQPLLAGPRDFDLRSALARTHRIEYKVRARARSDLSTHRIDEQRFECPVRSARRKRLATTPGKAGIEGDARQIIRVTETDAKLPAVLDVLGRAASRNKPDAEDYANKDPGVLHAWSPREIYNHHNMQAHLDGNHSAKAAQPSQQIDPGLVFPTPQ
jgi:hypothetical protein|tara:strand:+ start:608 stop:1105 length:498 start_codon:yes stop_codon:yes gene_type:complete